MTKVQRIHAALVAARKLPAGAARNAAVVKVARQYNLSTGPAGQHGGELRRLALFVPGADYWNRKRNAAHG